MMINLTDIRAGCCAKLSGPLLPLLERCPNPTISEAIRRVQYDKNAKSWTVYVSKPEPIVHWLLVDCGLKLHRIDCRYRWDNDLRRDSSCADMCFKNDHDDVHKVVQFLTEKCDKLQEDDTTDFTLESRDGTPFKVHKLLLMRSSTFSRVLSGQGAELAQRYPDLAQGKLRFGEASDETVQAFIRNLYCGEYKIRFSENEATVDELLHLAEAYDLPDLKNQIMADILSHIIANPGVAAEVAGKYGLVEKVFKILL